MSIPSRPVCEVCHRPLEASDQYLVRFHPTRGTTVVHRSLCFPPPRVPATPSKGQPGAATPA